MQLKAEVNSLRRTYEQCVIEKPAPAKRHYKKVLEMKTALFPEESRTILERSHRRHYSPWMSSINTISDRGTSQGKRHFDRSYFHETKDVLKHEPRPRTKSQSSILTSERNKSTLALSPKR
jgi:hypothetical protein